MPFLIEGPQRLHQYTYRPAGAFGGGGTHVLLYTYRPAGAFTHFKSGLQGSLPQLIEGF